jgi:myo-inositol-1(or 4)-monophosphatase
MKCFMVRLFITRSLHCVASKGSGAFLNGKPIHVSKTDTLKNSIVAIACGADIPEADSKAVLTALNKVIYNCRVWRRCGSAALDLAYVAAGRLDIYIEKGIHAWDIAAGVCILRESGGFVTDVSTKVKVSLLS